MGQDGARCGEAVPSGPISMTDTTRQVWDTYWQDYESSNYINFTPEVVSIVQAHLDLAQSRVLEIGVGTGGNSSLLAKQGAQVAVLDFSEQALIRAQRTAQHSNVRFFSVLADALRLPYVSGCFDLVFHQGFLEHFRDPGSLVQEQRRVLREDGYLLVDVPQRYNLYTPYKHYLIEQGRWPYGGWEREFSFTELCKLLKANGFCIIDAYGRGYFPRPFEMLHNLPRAEIKLFRRRIIPERWWNPYQRFWNRFERSMLGINTLQSVGILARAI
jgi:SAM-dependent methyltransferase